MRNGYTLRAFQLAGSGISAVTKPKFIHLLNHGTGTFGGLNLTLRKESK